MKNRWPFYLLLTSVSAGSLAYGATSTFTQKELDAKFPADLGPDSIDVSKYPAYQQQNYELFQHACSICHTLARPINTALVSQPDWARYVRRMHLRAKEQLLSKEDFNKVVDFLAYDSQQRKVNNKQEFDALQTQLHKRFVEVRREQDRLNRTKKNKAKEPAPYMGTP